MNQNSTKDLQEHENVNSISQKIIVLQFPFMQYESSKTHQLWFLLLLYGTCDNNEDLKWHKTKEIDGNEDIESHSSQVHWN